MTTPTFRGGGNIAIKTPTAQFDALVAFYRDTVGLEVVHDDPGNVAFRFGAIRLWVDRCPQMSQAEIWLELETDDTEAAARHLEKGGAVRCDAIEPLPSGLDGFWVSAPAQVIHLVNKPG